MVLHMKKGDTLQASPPFQYDLPKTTFLNCTNFSFFPQKCRETFFDVSYHPPIKKQLKQSNYFPADGTKGWQRDAHGNPLASHLQHQPCLSRFARDEGAQHQLGGRLDHLSVFWCSIHDKNGVLQIIGKIEIKTTSLCAHFSFIKRTSI